MSDLEVGNPETFIGEAEVMDLGALKGLMYMVAISTGDPTKCKYIQESLHGPYGFYEMVGEVDGMWRRCQHHAKVLITSKDMGKPPEFLDECTLDYLEAHAGSIITEGMLGGEDLNSDYTCKAGIFEADIKGLPKATEDES